MGKKKGGKAPNGRAKQKQKAHKGSTPILTPRSRGNGPQRMLLDDDWEEDTSIHFRGFAQSSPSTFTPRSAYANLRHQAISFVSAGVNAPIVQPKSDKDDAALTNVEVDIVLDVSDEADESNDEGTDDGLIQTNIMLDADMETPNQGVANLNINSSEDNMDIGTETDVATVSSNRNVLVAEQNGSHTLSFIVDTTGDQSLADLSTSAYRRETKRAPSPSLSDSSDEVVVFHGRGSKPAVINDPISRIDTPTAQPRIQETQLAVRPASDVITPSAPAVGWGARPSKYDTTEDEAIWTPASAIPYWKKGKGKAALSPDVGPPAKERDAYQISSSKQSKVQFAVPSASVTPDAEESIKALQADWKETLRAKKQGSHSSAGSRRKKRGRKKDNKAIREAGMSDDEMSEAAYNDYMENLRAQLDEASEAEGDDALIATLKATKYIAGPSLVVDGKEIADDEVLPKRTKAHVEEASIQLDDDSEWESDNDDDDDELNPDPNELSSDDSLNASDLEDSDLENELEYTERQQWEDEEDLRQRRVDRMSDEQIARLLAKQQELGMDADEILIEDGMYMSLSEEGFGDLDAARAGLPDVSKSTSTRRANKQSVRRRGDHSNHFPDASAFADTLDQYGGNGFDIMDFDRPSLRPRKKGRKGKLPPELDLLSDDELKEEMADQWAKDRAKKGQKKLEREELRASGLLGSAGRKGKADLRAKYPMGMDMRQVHDELQAFLQDEDLRERAFPPMDKTNRKALHEIAVALNLSSKSQGAGRNRFPILYKTKHTGAYSSEMFVQIVQASSRGFLTNRAAAKRFAKNGGVKGVGGGRGGGVTAASVRHGEIVGAGAAEISQDSFGHKMMLKMGWMKGQALGKDGEGLLVPVEQRMRVGTAGLG